MGAHMHMSEHMKMTDLRAPTPQDEERARTLLVTLRRALSPYRDYRAALLQGFRIFLPSVPQEVYHVTDYDAANTEYQGLFDPECPGSLLYVKKEGDYVLVGAMYSAPASYTPDQLNALIPLSVARWLEHVDICLPRGITLADLLHDKIGSNRSAWHPPGRGEPRGARFGPSRRLHGRRALRIRRHDSRPSVVRERRR
jgi:hypothetical protein